MFSGLVPGLNSVNYSPEDEVFFQAYADIRPDFYNYSVAFFQPELYSPVKWRALVLCVYVGVVMTITLIVLSAYSKEKEEEEEEEEGEEEKEEGDAESAILGSMHCFADALENENAREDETVSEILTMSSFCWICFEEKQTHQMFTNSKCSHSYCKDCTAKHIASKIQNNTTKILCPEAYCKSPLDVDSSRRIIPRDILVQWDELLCKSLIPESQKLYCPFADCSSMLVDDSGPETAAVTRTACPACRRGICAACRVPWHSEFSCREFQRLLKKKKKRGWGVGEELVRELAKKKKWRKCPQCGMYVEKSEGCIHVTCRCGCDFCYSCGSTWTANHAAHGVCGLTLPLSPPPSLQPPSPPGELLSRLCPSSPLRPSLPALALLLPPPPLEPTTPLGELSSFFRF